MYGTPFGRMLELRNPDGPRLSFPDSLDYLWHMEARAQLLPSLSCTQRCSEGRGVRQVKGSPLRVEFPRVADIIFVPLYARALMKLASELKKPNKYASWQPALCLVPDSQLLSAGCACARYDITLQDFYKFAPKHLPYLGKKPHLIVLASQARPAPEQAAARPAGPDSAALCRRLSTWQAVEAGAAPCCECLLPGQLCACECSTPPLPRSNAEGA